MSKANPIHPGQIVWHECIEALGMTIVGTAKALGVTRQQVHRLISGVSNISPEMAVRLSQVFGSSPETWLRMQAAYDLAKIQARGHIHLQRIGTAA